MGNKHSRENPSKPQEFECDKCGRKFPSIIRKIIHEEDCEARRKARAVGALLALHEMEKRRKMEELKRLFLAFNITIDMLKDDDDDDNSEDDSKKYLLGARVVRSDSWKSGDQDGGDGYVGTVIGIVSVGVKVVWDNGKSNTYRTGSDGSYDLLILDSRPAGVKHENISCDGCEEKDDCLRGARWKCHDCEDFDLCTPCFMAKKHDLKHRFIRFDTPESSGLLLPPRDTIAARIQSRGLFRGAVVQRGMHRGWRDQDGGAGKQGTILDIRGYRDEHVHDAAAVKWNNGFASKYMVGYDHQVDLKCVSPANGPLYYKKFLHLCGSPIEKTEELPFKIGDKVEIKFYPTQMKQMQKGHGGWQHHMVILINKCGRVEKIDSDNDVWVKYEKEELGTDIVGDGCTVVFNPATLKKVTESTTTSSRQASTTVPSNPQIKPSISSESEPSIATSSKQPSAQVVAKPHQKDLQVSSQKVLPSTPKPRPKTVYKKLAKADVGECSSGSSASSSAGPSSDTHTFKIGDVVKVVLPEDILKDIMVAHTDCWSDEMEKMIGKSATVSAIKPDNLVRVQYRVDDTSGLNLKNVFFNYHQEVLVLVPGEKGVGHKPAIEASTHSKPLDDSEQNCRICEDKAPAVIFRPCGHKILCQDCAGVNCKMKSCLSCGQSINKKEFPHEEETQKLRKQLEEMRESQMCSICIDNERNLAFNPCGHGSCDKCYPSLDKCHICRQSIESVLKIF